MIREIDVTELKAILEKDPKAPLIDVREQFEFSEVRAPRAQLMALSAIDPLFLTGTLKLQKSQTIYLICKSGGRSLHAAQVLAKSGFTDLVNIAGGTNAWVASGFETERG